MEWLALALVILIALIPPILLVKIVFLVQRKFKPESKPPRFVLYFTSYLLWFSALGAFVMFLGRNEILMQNSIKPSISSKHEWFPEFPWPPPAASSFETISLRRFLDFPEGALLDEYHLYSGRNYMHSEKFIELAENGRPLLLHADALLRFTLESAGHYETSYYSVPDGFALVSRLEQIEEDGSPMPLPARWETRVRSIGRFTLGDYLRALFVAPPGYYRLVVFIVCPHPFAQASHSISRDIAESWLRFGANALPIELALQPYTDHFICTALIYEFEKLDTQKEPILRQPGRLDARTHIVKSGIGRYLQ